MCTDPTRNPSGLETGSSHFATSRYCNTITMHHASLGQASICVESAYGFLNLKPKLRTILVAKWEVPVSKPERLPKRGVTYEYHNSFKSEQEASRPDSSAIYNWLSKDRKFNQSEIRSSRSRFEHYSKSLI